MNLHLPFLFLKVIQNFPSYISYYRERSKGAWTLSDGDNGWPMADATAEALKVTILQSFESVIISILVTKKDRTKTPDANMILVNHPIT
jgi:squalene cyclase